MKRIPGKRLLLYLLSSLAILFLFVLIFFTYQRLQDKRRQAILGSVLKEVDELMGRGFLVESRELLDGLVPRGRTSGFHANEFLRLLKRYHLYGRQTDDWAPYVEVARTARENYPGRVDLAALAVYGLLREGSWEAAADLAGYLDDSPFSSLKAELLMRSGKWTLADPGDLGPQGAVFFNSEPELLVAAGDATGLEPFYRDAALIFMGRGDFESARAIQRKYLNDGNSLFNFYLTLDLQDWQNALGYWDNISSSLESGDILLKGDILMRLGRFQAARQFYAAHITSSSEPSWPAFYNLAWLQEGREKESTLLQGLNRFPDEEKLNIAYTRHLISENREDEALVLLEDMIPRQILGLQGELILLRLLAARRSGSYLQGRYWELVNDYPLAPEAAQALVHYALVWGQRSDAETAFLRAEKNLGTQPWIQHWRGISAALDGRIEEGEKYFRAALETNPAPDIYYNYAVFLGGVERYEDAVSALEKGEQLCTKEDPIMGKILIRTGAFYYQMKSYGRAKDYVLRGLALLPRNLEGLFLLKSLEDV